MSPLEKAILRHLVVRAMNVCIISGGSRGVLGVPTFGVPTVEAVLDLEVSDHLSRLSPYPCIMYLRISLWRSAEVGSFSDHKWA